LIFQHIFSTQNGTIFAFVFIEFVLAYIFAHREGLKMSVKTRSVRITSIFLALIVSGMLFPSLTNASVAVEVPPFEVEVGDSSTILVGITNTGSYNLQLILTHHVQTGCDFGFEPTAVPILEPCITQSCVTLEVPITFSPSSTGECKFWLDVYYWPVPPDTGPSGSLTVLITAIGVPENQEPSTIVIDGCDTGVTDRLWGDDMLVSEWIEEYAENARSDREFLRKVARLTNSMKREGLITWEEKRAILSCAREASILSKKITVETNGSGTIVINGRDTKLEDREYNGFLISDHIKQCADEAKNHGQFMRCVAQLTRDMKRNGAINRNERRGIRVNAAKAKCRGGRWGPR